MHFFFGNWKMLDAPRNDNKLTCLDSNVAIPKLNQQGAFHDKEQLVFGFVMVPNELAFELDQLHKGIIYFADDFWAPVVLEGVELFDHAHFLDGC